MKSSLKGLLSACALLAAFASAAPAGAQDKAGFAPPGGHWMDWENNDPYHSGMSSRCGIDKASYDQWTRRLYRLATLWAQTPGATGPDLYGEMQGGMDSCKGLMRGFLLYWPWPVADVVFESVPGHPGRKRATHTGETGSLGFAINRLDGLTMIDELEPQNGIAHLGYLRPITRTFSGYPVYADQVLLITVPGHEPFAHVSLGEALHTWLADPRDNWGKARARELLAQLDAQGLRRPAYFHQTMNGHNEIVAEPGPDTTAVLRYNKQYYDRSLPKYVPQVLAVDVHLLDLVTSIDDNRHDRLYARRMLEATDWKRLAGLLMH
jgi:hypothetical protein